MDKRLYLFVWGIILLAIFNLFFLLNSGFINDYDEARHGVGAFEMMKNHNYIKNTYLGATDFWNLKPPLGLWLIVLSYKIFGTNSFALRFPSALSALLCIILSMYMANKMYNKRVAVFSGIILTTALWYLGFHSGRTGDFDSQMALIVALSVFFLFKMKDNPSYIGLVGLTAALGFLLKSFAFVQIFGIVIVFLLWSRRLKDLQFKHYVYFVIAFLVPILIWGYLRYLQDGTVFFNNMLSYDLFKRSLTPLEGHKADPFYMFYTLLWGIFPWSLFLFILPFYWKKHPQNNWKAAFDNKLLMVWLVVPLVMFSLAKTKCFWYINPLYPPLAILLAAILDNFFRYDYPKKKGIMVTFLVFLLLIETRIVLFITGTGFQTSSDQTILYSLESDSPNATIYTPGLAQSQVFIIEAVKHLNIKVAGIDDFIANSKTDDLILLNKRDINLSSLNGYGLTTLAENPDWLILKKSGQKNN